MKFTEWLRTFLRRFGFVINIVCALLLLCAYISLYINPTYFWPVAFLGLALPFLIVINLLFIVLWATRARLHILLSLIVLLLGWNVHRTLVQINWTSLFGTEKQYEKQTDDLKILTYNVRNFNFFNWDGKGDARKEIIDFVKNENPDIICFQEFYDETFNKKNKVNYNVYKELAKFKYIRSHLHPTTKGRCGIAIFSRYPIVNSGDILFEKTDNSSLFADIKKGNDTIRVYCNHLQSYRFQKDNYDLVDTMRVPSNSQQIKGIRTIGSRLKTAFIIRATQALMVSENVKHTHYPVIICGDFNDTPTSYTYHTMRSGFLHDAFVDAGSGFSNTYLGKFPSFRIDYVLYSPHYKAIQYKSPRIDYSDHYPVVCILRKFTK
jgi:endonuclease/exonuclease/phosphatase family metal-dependent hydrolase